MHNSGLNWGEIKLKIPGLSKAMLSRIRKGKAWKHLHHLVSSSVPEIRLGRILSQRDEVSVDIVCSLYKNGMAKYKIEKELKLDKGMISRILKMHGVNNWTKKQRVSILGQIQPNQFTNKK